MNTLTDIYRETKRIQGLAKNQIKRGIPRDFSYFDEQNIQEEANNLFPLLETCRRVGEIHAQHSATYQLSNETKMRSLDTMGFAPIYDTLLSLFKKSEKPL